jgi:pSer/pThr/pTyr-binding forkhead associated (FHA) protein
MELLVNRRELTFKALAGLAGGALGWIPVEIANHGHSLTQAQTTGSLIASFVSMALLSGMIGGFINAAQSQELALTRPVKVRFVVGFAICLLLSFPATYYSNLAFSYILVAGGWGVNHAGSIAYLVAARLAGWTLMGLLLGAGVGLATFTLSNVLKGAVGGWVGGFLGGIAFDAIGELTQAGLFSRLFGLSAIGLAIGLFIGLVQELTKTAWLKVEHGRLRGREFRLERNVAALGRAEESDVGLFGDPAVAARHAEIRRVNGDFVLKDLTRSPGTLVNGQRIENATLKNGDLIQIGDYAIRFYLRTGAAAKATETPPAASPPAGVPSGPRLVDARGMTTVLHAGTALRIGRALDNDLVVADQSVSRHHAAIASSDGAFYLRDLNSQNGSYVAGKRISEARLSDGVLVKLGDAEFHFRA